MPDMQRILIAIGAALLLAGLLWPWLSRLGLGRLPGDIRIETQNGVFYAPITTCVVISIILSVVSQRFSEENALDWRDLRL